MKNKILIVEDDLSISNNLKNYLSTEGFEVKQAISLAEAKPEINFDLAVLDWSLPDGEGLTFLKKIRKENINVPVIFLTAKADLIDKVLGLESGATDYLTKPFEPRELLARIKVHLGNYKLAAGSTDVLSYKHIKLDLKSRELFVNNESVVTTKKEFELLTLFLQNPNTVFTRDELLNKVWGFENFPTTRTVDTHILQLRQKIADDLFETVRGVGYKLKK